MIGGIIVCFGGYLPADVILTLQSYNPGLRRFLRQKRLSGRQGSELHEAGPAKPAGQPHLLAGREPRRHPVRGERGRSRHRRAAEGTGRRNQPTSRGLNLLYSGVWIVYGLT